MKLDINEGGQQVEDIIDLDWRGTWREPAQNRYCSIDGHYCEQSNEDCWGCQFEKANG